MQGTINLSSFQQIVAKFLSCILIFKPLPQNSQYYKANVWLLLFALGRGGWLWSVAFGITMVTSNSLSAHCFQAQHVLD